MFFVWNRWNIGTHPREANNDGGSHVPPFLGRCSTVPLFWAEIAVFGRGG